MDSPRPQPTRLANGSTSASNGVESHNQAASPLEIRLFYVRVTPCAADSAPTRLVHSINGSAEIPLRLDRAAAGEATYVSTGAARVASPSSPFRVADDQGRTILSGAISAAGSGWTMEVFVSSAIFAQGGAASPAFEVYVAGCVSGSPVVLTQTVQVSPRRYEGRGGVPKDVVPQGEQAATSSSAGMENGYSGDKGMALHRPFSNGQGAYDDDDDNEVKAGQSQYLEGWYADEEDGQLSWFNAGVRVGVGIGLGMCVGIGIGVGLLMQSYQATTRNLKRRFL